MVVDCCYNDCYDLLRLLAAGLKYTFKSKSIFFDGMTLGHNTGMVVKVSPSKKDSSKACTAAAFWHGFLKIGRASCRERV